MKTFKEFHAYINEASYAATAKAAERDWHSEKLTDTAKVQKTLPVDVSNKQHMDRMFKHHAKQLAMAKVKGDTRGIAYHQEKLKKFS